MPQCGTGFIENLAQWHRNQLEMRKKTLAFHDGQGAENVVVVWFGARVHSCAV